jgi:hypothetical protein
MPFFQSVTVGGEQRSPQKSIAGSKLGVLVKVIQPDPATVAARRSLSNMTRTGVEPHR